MAGKVTVGCRLPHGLTLRHPMDSSQTVEIQGLNKSNIIGADCMFTEVDADFWDAWIMVHSEFPAITSNAIFVGKNKSSAEAIAAEVKDEKTGFEGAPQTGAGVAPATTDE